MRFNIDGVIGEVDSLPGCSQVAVSHAVYVPMELRGKGLGKQANDSRLQFLKEHLGYDYTLCTVDMANEAQIKILIGNGWRFLDNFRSSKTGHLVGIYGYELKCLDDGMR